MVSRICWATGWVEMPFPEVWNTGEETHFRRKTFGWERVEFEASRGILVENPRHSWKTDWASDKGLGVIRGWQFGA